MTMQRKVRRALNTWSRAKTDASRTRALMDIHFLGLDAVPTLKDYLYSEEDEGKLALPAALFLSYLHLNTGDPLPLDIINQAAEDGGAYAIAAVQSVRQAFLEAGSHL